MNVFYRLAESLNFLNSGRVSDAETAARLVLVENPYLPHAQRILHTIYAAREDQAAIEALDEEISANCPYYSDVEMRRGTRLLQAGRAEDARDHFDRALNFPLALGQTRMLPFGTVTRARLKHDLYYLNYLTAHSLLPKERFLASTDTLVSLLRDFQADSEATVQLDAEQLLGLASVYRRCLYLHNPPIPDRLINKDAVHSALARYRAAAPDDRFVWFDSLFSEECLRALKGYLLLSSIWHNDGQKGAGYVGAYENNGLRHPLVEAILRELEQIFWDELQIGPVKQVWCYKNVEGTRGVGVHADFSCVNLNVWLTPDQYNLDPDSGGLVVYRRRAPSDWPFERYNNDDAAIEGILCGADKSRVPYRENRAMVFDSALFHGSNGVQFSDCYEGFRINMTFLFGQR